jgi:ribokinase
MTGSRAQKDAPVTKVLVVGQVGRDLVLAVERVPESDGHARIVTRREMLGGKGANQAVALTQLGADVDLVGVAGEDAAGDALVRQIERDGIGTRYVIRRGRSALLVDVVDGEGSSRLLEDLPQQALLRGEDVASITALERYDTLSLQLQQPIEAILPLARRFSAAGAHIVLDGSTEGNDVEELLNLADVLRVDAREAEILVGQPVQTAQDAAFAAALLRSRGPAIVAVASGDGNTIAWGGQQLHLPFGEVTVLDSTGGGDSFVAGLITGLRRGLDPGDAGRLAVACSGSTVTHLGGRPDLSSVARTLPDHRG